LFLVLVKMDNGGSAVVACKELAQDPLFPGKVVLVGVQALSWPFQGQFLHVQQWSIDRDVVLNWMCGPLEQTPELTAELLSGTPQKVPWPPGSKPTSELVTDSAKFKPAPEVPPAPPKAPPKDPPAPPKALRKAEPTPEAPGLQTITILGR